eukprot:251530-Prymnesium_polylepis.1
MGEDARRTVDCARGADDIVHLAVAHPEWTALRHLFARQIRFRRGLELGSRFHTDGRWPMVAPGDGIGRYARPA